MAQLPPKKDRVARGAARRGKPEDRKKARRGHFSLKRKLFRIRTFFGELFYRVGMQAEYHTVLAGRALRRAAGFLGRFAARLLAPPLRAVFQALAGVWHDLTSPFRQLRSGFANIRAAMKQAGAENDGRPLRVGWQYLCAGVRAYGHLAKNLLYYLLPLAAGVAFVVTVTRALDRPYVLQVECEGQVVGYVEQESVYQAAILDLENQLVYTDQSQEWRVEPAFSIAAEPGAPLSSSQMLVDAILRSSGAEITEAVGLYVDGVFYGATDQVDRLDAAIEAMKEPYRQQYPGAEIAFVEDVQLREGIYLTESIQPYSSLNSLLHKEVQGQRKYVIQKGDTPWEIAGANGVTVDELYSLNPVLENGRNLPIGQELVIGQAVPFLQIKAIVTTVERESIAYETQTEYSTDLAFGVQRVLQEGVEGQKDVTYQTTYLNGQAVERVAVGEPDIISQPVTQIQQMGVYVNSDGVVIEPGNGILMFPIGPGYGGMSRGYSGPLLPYHNGLDLYGAMGTPIYAAQSGVVVSAVYSYSGYGIHLQIDHGGGIQTLYAHCSGLVVSTGDVVRQGELIAYMGSTGWSTGPHCHFEVLVNGVRRDPMGYLG